MGYGSYSHAAHEAITSARAHTPRAEVFRQTACHALMNPHGVRMRESRDSAAHPNSVGIAFALDVTGSMGSIPEALAKKELPQFMKILQDGGIADPQIFFMAVGDATCDRAPLQVGQFESAAKEMDEWLTRAFLESGGGGQNTESYELGFYFAARHTAMDCFEKRQKKGYLFMTGDEEPYPQVSASQVSSLIGDQIGGDIPVARIIEEVRRTYEPFFLIPDQARRARCESTWRRLLGDHVICMDSPEDTCRVAAGIVQLVEGVVPDLAALEARLNEGSTRGHARQIVKALEPFAATLRPASGRGAR